MTKLKDVQDTMTLLTDEQCAESDYNINFEKYLEEQAGQITLPEKILRAAFAIRDEQAAASATDPLLALREMAEDDEEALVSARLLVDLLEALASALKEPK